jgi:hypothetical protein
VKAFIVFENSAEARRATQKDRETFGDKFGDRYVRVYPTLDSDFGEMQGAVSQQALGLLQVVYFLPFTKELRSNPDGSAGRHPPPQPLRQRR